MADIHSNLQAFEAVIGSFPEEGGYDVICAGDVVGYGADPVKCIDTVLSLGVKNIVGNHDAGVIDKTDISYFNKHAAEAVQWTKEHLDQPSRDYLEGLQYVREEELFTVAHGTLHDPEEFMYMMTWADAMHTFEVLNTKICFVGHSHVPGTFILRGGEISQSFEKKIGLEEEARYIVNVGSVGQPRDGDNRSCYCVYDADKDEIEFRRIEYDIKTAAKRIVAAGLPEVLAERLFVGR